MRVYSPFYPSNYGQGVYSETKVHNSHGFIKLTVVYVSLAESTRKDMLTNVSFEILYLFARSYIQIKTF
jgi:hypothetical protein